MERIQKGLRGKAEMIVGSEDLASFAGNLGAEVLSTHRVVLLMEQAARDALSGCLGEGMMTVGTAVRVRHLAATPLGARVQAEAKVTGVDGRRLLFEVRVYDELETIAEGENERYVVTVKRFLAKVAQKQKRKGASFIGRR
jgi:predicted thioesterase